MVQTRLKLEGGAKLRRTLKRAGVDLQDLKDANAAVADYVAQKAAKRAPRLTGALASSGRGNRAVGRAVVTFGRARIPYANPIHWGWPKRHIKANPFASQAAQDTEDVWLGMYAKSIQAILDQVEGV